MPLAAIAGDPDPGGADCVACGRCCHHGPSTVHLLEPDMEQVITHFDLESVKKMEPRQALPQVTEKFIADLRAG